MKKIKTIFESIILIEPTIFNDNRGYFYESYHFEKLKAIGITQLFMQDNHSLSRQKGTIRGMHFQSNPKAQTKLVRVVSGAIINLVVDIRKGSPTYKKFCSFELSAENKHLLYIPKGFANGFKTIQDNTEVLYKVDQGYAPDYDRSFRFDDPEIGIDWEIDEPIISNRDKNALSFSDVDHNFIYEVKL